MLTFFPTVGYDAGAKTITAILSTIIKVSTSCLYTDLKPIT